MIGTVAVNSTHIKAHRFGGRRKRGAFGSYRPLAGWPHDENPRPDGRSGPAARFPAHPRQPSSACSTVASEVPERECTINYIAANTCGRRPAAARLLHAAARHAARAAPREERPRGEKRMQDQLHRAQCTAGASPLLHAPCCSHAARAAPREERPRGSDRLSGASAESIGRL